MLCDRRLGHAARVPGFAVCVRVAARLARPPPLVVTCTLAAGAFRLDALPAAPPPAVQCNEERAYMGVRALARGACFRRLLAGAARTARCGRSLLAGRTAAAAATTGRGLLAGGAVTLDEVVEGHAERVGHGGGGGGARGARALQAAPVVESDRKSERETVRAF